MSKRINLIALFALGLLVFLIWTDPGGAATTVGDFLGKVGSILKAVLDKITEFLGELGKK